MKYYAYVGCRTTKERNARGKGIKIFEVEDGVWKEHDLMDNLVNPSFQCFDQSGKYLYSIHGDYSEISSFAVKEDGKLTYLNTVSTEGVNPVHLSVDKDNRWIFVANLQTGSVVVIPRNEDGTLAFVKEVYRIPGLKQGDISHPHQVTQDPRGTYLTVSCQGRKAGFGQVNLFRIVSRNGVLEHTCTVRSREIAEPRHFVYHSNMKYAYGVNEKDYSVTAYDFDYESGSISAKQVLPTLPNTYTGDGWASGIVLTKDEKFVVVSNRKHDSITSFAIDAETGYLKYCDCIKTGGGQPRFITVTLEGTILVANETTDSLTEFLIDAKTGRFTKTDLFVETESPVCVIFHNC